MSDVAEQVYEQAPSDQHQRNPGHRHDRFHRRQRCEAQGHRGRSGRGVQHRGLPLHGGPRAQPIADRRHLRPDRTLLCPVRGGSPQDACDGRLVPRLRAHANRAAWARSAPCWNCLPTIPTSCAASRCTRRTAGPTTCPASSEVVTAYQDAMLDLSVHIRQMFAIGLDLPGGLLRAVLQAPADPAEPALLPRPAQHGPQGPQDRRGRAFRHRRLHHPDAGPGRRARGQAPREGLGSGHAHRGDLRRQYRRRDDELDQRALRLEPAPGGEPQGQGAHVPAAFRQCRLRRDHRADPGPDRAGHDPITGPIHFGKYMDEFYKGRWISETVSDPATPISRQKAASVGSTKRPASQDRDAVRQSCSTWRQVKSK
jgi:hypothetical protein